jgi:hypothetical protein
MKGGRSEYLGDRRGSYRIVVGVSEGKRPLGRPRRSWEDNSKTGFQKLDGGKGGDWEFVE